MAKFKLVKVQTPIKNTNELLAGISELDVYEQIIVDPQSPKEQARIQGFKDDLEDSGARLIKLSSILNVQLEELPTLNEEDKKQISDPNKVISNLKSFLEKYEETIIAKKKDLEKFQKEERILSVLKLFQDKIEQDELSIDLLSSSSGTFTLIGEIPTSYEEFIIFYLHEITAGKTFLWSSETNKPDKKVAIIISLEEYREQISDILKENYFDETGFDFEVLKSIEKLRKTTKISELYLEVTNDNNRVKSEINKLADEIGEEIRHRLTLISNTHSMLTREEKGRSDSKNFTLWGWINSKKFSEFNNYIKKLDFKVDISVLEDVPLSRKKESDLEQEAFKIKTFDLVEKEVSKHIPHPPHAGGGEGFLFAGKAVFVKLESKEKNTRELISYVHSLNSIHPVKIGSLDDKALDKLNNVRTELTQYQAKITRLIDIIKPEKKKQALADKFQISDEYKHSKSFIENFLRKYEEKIINLSTEIDDLRRKRDQIELSIPFEEGLKDIGIDSVLLQSGFQTITHLGAIPKNHYKSVKFFLNEVTDGNLVFWDSASSDSSSNYKNILIISLKEYDRAVSRVLNEYSFQPIETDMKIVDRKESLRDILTETEEELSNKDEEMEKLIAEVSDKLLAADELITNELHRLATTEKCQINEGKIVMWGWISKSKLKNIEKEKDSLPFDLEITTNPEVPLINPAITKRGKVFGAVRGIVGGIGQPGPGEVDPYSIVRFTFPFLFGIMFADVGHGILMALIAGIFVFIKKRKKIEPDESMTGYLYSGAELLLFCGLSSTFFGFLFGSLLGDEYFLANFYHSVGIDWLPLLNPLHETKFFLVVVLFIGFLMIQLGVLLKVYQNLRYGHGFASWAAPLTLSIIYVGIFALLYNIIADGVESHTFHWELPQFPGWVVYLVGLVPLLFVFEYLHAKSDGIMDAIDHIIALISNTLSFSRLMALLLVHAILSGLPFTLTGVDVVPLFSSFASPNSLDTLIHIVGDSAHYADFFSHYAGGLIEVHHISALSISWVWWIVGIVLALFLIIPLEGLLSFLNTLRLHWVEWFTKFYAGSGKEYIPIIEKLNYINYVTVKGR